MHAQLELCTACLICSLGHSFFPICMIQLDDLLGVTLDVPLDVTLQIL